MILIALMSASGGAAAQEAPPPSPEPSGTDVTDMRSYDFERASHASSAFAEAASRDGLTVAPEEVTRRATAYEKLYPGKDIDPAKVKGILLAEKYLAAKGIGAGDGELDRAVAGNWDPSRFATPQEAEQARQSLRTRVLFDRQDVKRKASELKDLAQIDLLSGYKPTPQWEPPKLQIQGDPEECLAWSGPACFLTLREYNAACTQFQLPAQVSLDSARSDILRKYLLAKRRAERARARGLGQRPDSIVEDARMSRDGVKWLLSSRRFGLPVFDEAQLQAAYGKYYRRYFAARQRVTFAVVGSTDSAYVDSLHGVLAAWERTAKSRRGPEKERTQEPGLPWVYFPAEELPGELEAKTDSLRIGQSSKPFRTPYGYFILRLAKVADIREIPFAQASSQLTFLAGRDKFLGMDSVVEAKARRYYAENQIRYSAPDTMGLKAWLIPGPVKANAARSGGKSKSPVLSDTADFKAMATASLSLPAEIQLQLREAVRKDTLKAFYGPLPDRCGHWYFKVLSRKPAHGVLPYRLARKDILERISAPLPDEDAGSATEESIDEVLLNMGLSEAYLREEARKSMEMEEAARKNPESDPNPQPGNPSEDDQDKAIAAEMARMQEQMARYRREEEALLAGTRVNKALIRR